MGMSARSSLCLLVSAWLCDPGAAYAAKPDCAMPEELVVAQYAGLMGDNSRGIATRLYPLGWSENGLFAWITTQFEENAGFTNVVFAVIDTRTDRITEGFEQRYGVEDVDDPRDQARVLAKFWKSFGARVCKSLRTHGIVQRKPRFVSFPYEVPGDTISAELRPAPTKDKPLARALMCLSKARGEKRIATLQAGEAIEPCEVNEPHIVGAIAHPNGQRLLVLAAFDVSSDPCGPKDIIFYSKHAAGCDLTKSFLPRAK